MQRKIRIAAFTAGVLTLCAAGGLAAPSIAQQSGAGPTASYVDHAGSTLTVETLGLNDLSDLPRPALADAFDAPTPVATHALDPALPEVDSDAEEETDSRNGRSLAQLVDDYAGTETADEESECLARAVYWESKGEPLAGQLTVAEVIINRSQSRRFPSTICGVVRQPSQFSFVRGGNIPRPPVNAQWRTAVAIARIALADLADGGAPRALFFHARYVRPGWHLTRIATVGNHIFYR